MENNILVGYLIGFFFMFIGGYRLYSRYKSAKVQKAEKIWAIGEIVRVLIEAPIAGLLPFLAVLLVIVALTAELIRKLF